MPLKNNARLYAGEYLDVELSGGVIADAMQVPRSAVFNNNEAFVVIDGKLQKRLVDVLKTNEKSVVIRGLDKGIYVVTQPLINVAENTDVKILGVDKPTTPEKGRAGQETAAR